MTEITKYVSRNGDNPTYSTDLERLSDATIASLAGLGFLNNGKIIGGDWDGTSAKALNVGYLYFNGKLWGFPASMTQYTTGYLYAVAEWDADSTKTVTSGATKIEYQQRIKYTQAVEQTRVDDVSNADGTGKWFVGHISSSMRDLRELRYGVINGKSAFLQSLAGDALALNSITSQQLLLPHYVCSIGSEILIAPASQATSCLLSELIESDAERDLAWTKQIQLSTDATVNISTVEQFAAESAPDFIPLYIINPRGIENSLSVHITDGLGQTTIEIPRNNRCILQFQKQIDKSTNKVGYFLSSITYRGVTA